MEEKKEPFANCYHCGKTLMTEDDALSCDGCTSLFCHDCYKECVDIEDCSCTICNTN